MSAHINDSNGGYRAFYFLHAKAREISGFIHYTNAYPPELEGEVKMLPPGYEMIGIATHTDTDGSIKAVGFMIWKA